MLDLKDGLTMSVCPCSINQSASQLHCKRGGEGDETSELTDLNPSFDNCASSCESVITGLAVVILAVTRGESAIVQIVRVQYLQHSTSNDDFNF